MNDKCEECMWVDEITGACTNDTVECVDGSAYVKALGPEEMFKSLYMLLYSSGGEMSFPPEALDKFDDTMKIIPNYDPESKRYSLETSHKPPKPVIIAPPKKIQRRHKRLIVN